MPVHLMYQWAQEGASNVARDRAVNTWHFQVETSPPPPATLTAINTALNTFYQSMAGSFPASLVSSTGNVKVYNLADPKPRAPVTQYVNTLTGLSGGNALPAECCICVSFQAAMVSGTPAARRKGRVYIGPLAANQCNPDGSVITLTLNNWKTYAAALLAASDAAPDWSWCVFSPTAGALAPVVRGWVDNAIDIQRRRGRSPTIRTIWP